MAKYSAAKAEIMRRICLNEDDAEEVLDALSDIGVQFDPEGSAVDAFHFYAVSLGTQTGNDLRELAYAAIDELQAEIARFVRWTDRIEEESKKKDAEIARLKAPESPELVILRENYKECRNKDYYTWETEALRARAYIAELERR